MKKIYSAFLFTFFCFTVMGQITITSFNPSSGTIGSTVVITGANFNSTPSNNIVFFGGAKATVSAGSSTSLTVTIPVGASFQYISVTDISSNLTAYSDKPFVVTFSCGNGINAGSMGVKTDFATGIHPVGITSGDIDGDGKSDLVLACAQDNSVSVLRNTSTSGNIIFAPGVNFPVGTYPWGVALGDLDGDGKLDIASANGTSNSTSVLRNTSTIGTISFTTKIDYAAGTQPYSVSIGDLNKDGKPDLAVANFGNPGLVSVYKNTSSLGSLSFSTKVNFSTGSNPKTVFIGDVDGDGLPDLTTANFNSAANSISILRNLSVGSSISFATKIDYPTGTNPYALAEGDLDGDGKPEIVVTNNGNSTVSVFRNTSISGTITLAARVNFTTNSSPVAVFITDLDGDGKLDFAVLNQFSNNVSLFKNLSTIGSISFGTKVDFNTGTVPYSLSICDMDGDERPDLNIANATANTFSVLRNLQCPIGILSYDKPLASVNIYPNPFSSQATIKIKDFKNEKYQLHIVDVTGKEIFKSEISNEITEFDRKELPSGIYFLQLFLNEKIMVNEKMVIQ